MILVGIIAAKSKPFVVHLNVLNYNNCPSIGRYLFLNPVKSSQSSHPVQMVYIYIYNCRQYCFGLLGLIIIYIYIYIYIVSYIALWCKNQIEHSIWDESLLFCNCACSLEYSSLSTLVGLSYHICGKLEVDFEASPSSQHQHCTDEAQKAESVLSDRFS